MKLMHVVGARPNFMKVAPIHRAIGHYPRIQQILVHTGQHYDINMSDIFFQQLGLPAPDINLEVGSGSHAMQTAQIMMRFEEVVLKEKPDLVLVYGDVTSTMACSITAQKLRIPVAHVEAGIRSGDWTMPEEINRIITDAITNYFFTTSEIANQNLRRSGVSEERIFFVGNTMIDTLLANIARLRAPAIWDELRLQPGQYFVMTLHRPANVDETDKLKAILLAIGNGCRDLPVVFPAHPRTAKILRELAGLPRNIKQVEPQPYLEFNYLVKYAKAVITDSGGITEEATVMDVPCMTLRDTTERPETITIGTNELIGTDPDKLKPALDRLFAGQWKKGGIPEKWDGKAGERIALILEQMFSEQ